MSQAGGKSNVTTLFQVVDKTAGVADIPEWFAGSRLNFAENLLRHYDDRVAIYSTSKS